MLITLHSHECNGVTTTTKESQMHSAYQHVLALMTDGKDLGDALDEASEKFNVDWDELADYFTAAET